MSNLSLTVGTSYVTAAWSEEEPFEGSIVKIVGTVDPETVEYSRGMRFVGSNRVLYTQDGYAFAIRDLMNPDDFSIPHKDDLVTIASTNHLKDGYAEYKWVDLTKQPLPNNFIPSTNPEFKMQNGGLYVDRSGFYRFVDELAFFHDEEMWGPDGECRFIGRECGFWSSGRENNERLSMSDAIYQVLI